ncbi:hypothetical protein RV11_GL000951 [Enterococcus phoeniculicola]|uniref:AB hydrolase-1 domain-containing protein n=1 Tax=Enterococcus phoeniculicola ATCC BAA-412 TaxID=1158610 RepID=R3W2C1_9ENTE|nr:alpha/beta hydrolase [Enterococcus phoeniculicola]EOL41576.1 hypothetical protein UC3_03139 [Enterococcus phoeniculicola ATCC BAA-412]EOT78930.1 hypothetical protein I589_00437 [Enterococcus phoeniculicola ATCC BAA-412]OJG70704.1 hypothetical protein RV11_GL000951 [Enterococcus phoeniculicola]
MECQFFIQSEATVKLASLLSGNEQSEQIIIFLHGGPGSGYAPLRKIPAFKELEKQYLCFYFDQRSSGNSLYPTHVKMTKKELVDDVIQMISYVKKKFPKKQLYLFGGSFGGSLALHTIQQFSDDIQGLILSCPAVFFDNTTGEEFFRNMLHTHIQTTKLLFTSDDFDSILDLPAKDFFNHPQIKKYIYSKENQSTSTRYTAQISDWFFTDHLAGVFASCTIPMCIIQGKNDPICFEQAIDNQVKLEKNALISYHALDSCGHAPFEDQPQIFLDIIHKFIQEGTKC